MSTEEKTAEGSSTPQKSSGGKLAIAVIATAALAGTGGFVVANSTGGDEGTTTAASSGEAGGESATTINEVDIPGENRGYEDVHTDEPLVTTDWLAERLDEGDLYEQGIVLLDVSEDLPTSELTPYAEAHIPQAQYVEWSSEFTQPNTREFIDADEFTELAQSLGINDDTTVVLYGDNNNWFAAYAAWVFNLYGVEDVKLLDGGLHKWEAYDERELVEEVPSVPEGDFEAKPQNHDIRAFQPEVLEIAEENAAADGENVGEFNLVDIRSAEEHNGEVGVDPEIFEGEGASIWGHIPGSVNVTWTEIVDEETGEFLPEEEIRAIYEEAGVDFDKPIIAYCRIGERASHTWYALSQILGEEVKVYDGSWSEWGNSVGVPVANNSGERAGLWGQQ
ncbi:sulfurtransferase [Nesterenkonia sp. MY13]|uniref:Sulfurtransferase n=1 Tax=Nesterenkonia sedimenti TaxID=1463632 RepID=A0A7X8YDQ5_9MICC|nr:sulfurtransferase [Nesterenkonia sedimenti]NLS09611.1 sulfurtransferase [Nesterenkonia sedimenti]